MVTQTEPLNINLSSYVEDLTVDVRYVLRVLGAVHAYWRKGVLVTIDVPFKPLISKNGLKMAFVIDKSRIPRVYPLENIRLAKPFITQKFGFPVEIRETRDEIAICIEISEAERKYHDLHKYVQEEVDGPRISFDR